MKSERGGLMIVIDSVSIPRAPVIYGVFQQFSACDNDTPMGRGSHAYYYSGELP